MRSTRLLLPLLLTSILPSVVAGMAMAATLILWVHWSAELHVVAQLVVGVLLGALVYVAALSMIDPDLFGQARRFLSSARKLREAAR